MLSYVGSINMGILSPLSLTVSAALTAQIVTDLAGLVALTASLTITPPSFALSITALTALEASLTAAIGLGLPSVDFQATVMLEAIVTLTAELILPLSFRALLEAEAGIFVYGYNGTGRDFGAATTAGISRWPDGTAGDVASNALIVATVSPPVWTNVEAFLGILPPSLPRGLTYVAEANLALVCPLCIGACGPIIADLEARLAGAIALSASLAVTLPTFATSLVSVFELLVTLLEAIAIGLPGVVFQLEAIARAIVAVEAKIALLAELTVSLGGGGAYVYTYSGPGAGLGTALTASLAGGWPDGASAGLPANAAILGTVEPTTWTTMSLFFGGA